MSAPHLVALDARDAFLPMPHGSGIYVARLLAALQALDPPDITLWPLTTPPRGPEVLWEQLVLPVSLRLRQAALVHGPNSFLPLRRRCPGVLTVHDLVWEAMPGEMDRRTELKYRALTRASARSAQAVICPSTFTAQDVERRYGVSPERIRIIPEAPALPAGDREPPPGPYLLAAGDLRPKKNLATLVTAFARLHAAGLPHRLLIAGADLGSAASLHRLAAASPVDLLGFQSDAELDALIRGADALVVPSLYEGFGLVVLDAMVRGCPVVLARAGALPETAGDAALSFDPLDASELATTLEALLGSPAQRDRLSRLGRERAAGFTWEAAASATLDVYRELL